MTLASRSSSIRRARAWAIAWDVLPDAVRVDPYSGLQPVPFVRPLLVLLPAVASVAASIYLALL